MQLADIKAPIADDLALVSKLLDEKAHTDTAHVNDVSQRLIQRSGKQLRPILLLLVANAFNHTKNKERASYAVAIEYIHIATLLHDDVIDNSEMRRGYETINATFGSKVAILAGDFLYTQSMLLLVNLERLNVMHAFADVVRQITKGEIKQLMLSKSIQSEQDYFEVIKDKTSLLFSLAAKTGALITQQANSVCQQLNDFGLHLGNAFQIVDDILDFTADAKTLGKNIGDDFKEGKSTLPIIQAYKVANTADANYLKACIEKPGDFNLDKVLSIIEKTDALTYARNKAQDEINKAKTLLVELEESPYKKALFQLCDFAISRSH